MLQLVMLWILAFGIYVSLIMMLGRPKGGSATPLTGPRWALADLDFAHCLAPFRESLHVRSITRCLWCVHFPNAQHDVRFRRDKQNLLIDRSRRVLLIINPTLQGPTLRRQGCAPCFSQPSISARETNYSKQVFYFHRGLRFSRNAVWDGVWQNGFTLIGRGCHRANLCSWYIPSNR